MLICRFEKLYPCHEKSIVTCGIRTHAHCRRPEHPEASWLAKIYSWVWRLNQLGQSDLFSIEYGLAKNIIRSGASIYEIY